MKNMVTSYCPQYSIMSTNNSAKPLDSDIFDCILLLPHPYALLQSWIMLPHTDIYFNTMLSAHADKCHRDLFYGTHPGHFKAVENIVENIVHYSIHCFSWDLLRLSHLFDHLFLNSSFVFISWISTVPEPINFLQRGCWKP